MQALGADRGAISEAEAVVGFGVYFCASAEELPAMWVDGDLDKVLQRSPTRAHTHTHSRAACSDSYCSAKNMENL